MDVLITVLMDVFIIVSIADFIVAAAVSELPRDVSPSRFGIRRPVTRVMQVTRPRGWHRLNIPYRTARAWHVVIWASMSPRRNNPQKSVFGQTNPEGAINGHWPRPRSTPQLDRGFFVSHEYSYPARPGL
jgi:hypothetical protein